MPDNLHFFENGRQLAFELRVNPRFRMDRVAHSYASAWTQYTPCFIEDALPVANATQNLHQQYDVKDAIAERQLSSIGQRQKAVRGVRRKLLQHGGRSIHANIKISRCYERFADPSRSRANVEHA